ncbi:hypothetical protein [Hymenobacter siberiensis]|uniref:hypothetical protein n=1 Tax=Hymenobacter siberiensis TaxID=2848396 RepID=UPI001C1E58E0|nr:hypothetical protein [Hymenobacter siberiensis]
MRKKECYTSNFALFWESFDFLNSFYKSILKQLLAEHIYEVLVSPAFSKQELAEYIDDFSEDDKDYSLDEVIEEYISQNPNFSVE